MTIILSLLESNSEMIFEIGGGQHLAKLRINNIQILTGAEGNIEK